MCYCTLKDGCIWVFVNGNYNLQSGVASKMIHFSTSPLVSIAIASFPGLNRRPGNEARVVDATYLYMQEVRFYEVFRLLASPLMSK